MTLQDIYEYIDHKLPGSAEIRMPRLREVLKYLASNGGVTVIATSHGTIYKRPGNDLETLEKGDIFIGWRNKYKWWDKAIFRGGDDTDDNQWILYSSVDIPDDVEDLVEE